MDLTKKAIVIISIISTLVLVAIIAGCSSDKDGPGRYDAFAQCLTEKGVTMYGTEWCPHCQNQKALFGSSFDFIDYVDCDKNRAACVAAGVEGYPTWKINGENYAGEQSFVVLKRLTGCEIEPSMNETTEPADALPAEINDSEGACDVSEDGTCTFPG